MNEITKEDFLREREKIVAVCANSHSESFVRHKPASADAVKMASDAIAGEAIKVMRGLYKDGLLNPMPDARPANPLSPGIVVELEKRRGINPVMPKIPGDR